MHLFKQRPRPPDTKTEPLKVGGGTVAKNSLFFKTKFAKQFIFMQTTGCRPGGRSLGAAGLGRAGREGPPGVTEQGKKAGVDGGLFQDCLAPASRSPLPPRLPVMILTGAGW